MRIMLVDDEERFLLTMKRLLAKRGCHILTATRGSEALELLEKHTVHVVILDMKMPGLDGIATLRQIKTFYPHVEVIMLTGHATAESAVDVLKSGAFDYVMKPCDIEELLQKAAQAFEKVRESEEKMRQA